MEIQELYSKIQAGEDVRANLIALRRELKEEEKQRALAYLMGGDFEVFIRLLDSTDPKVRKNAALILGEMETEDVLPSLFHAYEKEETLFVRSDFLKAIARLDYTPCLPKLKERLGQLRAAIPEAENRKHLREEQLALQEMILRYEKPKPHRFTGYDPAPEVILLTNRSQRETVKAMILEGSVTELPAGLRIRNGNLRDLMKIRVFNEMLFPIPGAVPLSGTPEQIGEALAGLRIPDYLDRLHEKGEAYYYRMDIRGPLPLEKKGPLIRRIAEVLDGRSGGKLCNTPSGYEVELRLLERRDGSFLPMLRLHTLPDRRFAYRKETVAASIAPVNAALAVELARPYLRENGQVLDPFCGVGTMLTERAKALPAHDLYGVDIYRDAIEKARRNAENAGCVIHYINRDYFDFTHSYLFDEIITDMPRSQGEEAKEESRKLYGRFFEKSLTHLKDGGMMVLYTMEPELAEAAAAGRPEYELLEEFLLNEKNDTRVMVFRIKK